MTQRARLNASASALAFLIASTPPADAADTITAHAAQVAVIDGDTLAVGRTRVRLWGIDAPEKDTPAGIVATQYLMGILTTARQHGSTLRCTPKGHSHARVVALCTLDGIDIAALMVQRGVVHDCPRYSGGYYANGSASKAPYCTAQP